MSDLSGELKRRLRDAEPDAAAIRARLDAASHAERVTAVRELGRAEQRSLYRAVRGHLPLALADLVAPAVPDGVAVRHHGVNSLPLFSHFEKRFCRPAGEDPEKPVRLYGFNFQRLTPITGPGYFVALEDPALREVRIDYTRLPERAPEGWPALRSNERGLARFVYGFMVDTLRRVSEHVTVGSAARRGRDMNSWFVLVREDFASGPGPPAAFSDVSHGSAGPEVWRARRPPFRLRSASPRCARPAAACGHPPARLTV